MKLFVDVSNGMLNPIHYCTHKSETYYRKDYVDSLKAKIKSFGQSSSDLKTEFIGEFSWEEKETFFDDDGHVMYGQDGDPVYRKVNRDIPWTLLKQIFREMSEYVRNRKNEDYRP